MIIYSAFNTSDKMLIVKFALLLIVFDLKIHLIRLQTFKE